MHCFVFTLLSVLTPSILLHNFRLNPGKGKRKENLKSKISKKFENEDGEEREETHTQMMKQENHIRSWRRRKLNEEFSVLKKYIIFFETLCKILRWFAVYQRS